MPSWLEIEAFVATLAVVFGIIIRYTRGEDRVRNLMEWKIDHTRDFNLLEERFSVTDKLVSSQQVWIDRHEANTESVGSQMQRLLEMVGGLTATTNQIMDRLSALENWSHDRITPRRRDS